MAKEPKTVKEGVDAPQADAGGASTPADALLSVTVAAKGVGRRCRAGLCFGADPAPVEVTAVQLAALRADPYLVVTE